MNEKKRWLIVVVFALAMAWVEAAAVVYIRTLVNRIEPHQPEPMPRLNHLDPVELVREAATLVMLFAVGGLAGRTWRSRLGYTLVAFGVWDIFYYFFLKIICDWPRSLMDWDILFLLPLPWWGPVLAPMLIAASMVLGGTLITQYDEPGRPLWPRRGWFVLNVLGIALALYVFMADTIAASGGGEEAIRRVLPTRFNWPLFLVSLVLMAAPLGDLFSQVQARRGPATDVPSSRPRLSTHEK